ncbi:hypothetical protein [Nocardia puris]|uniref:hypothetical protein n=1 Tax=Nocardia puris TaxID=208602 RepID=UPI002E1AFDED
MTRTPEQVAADDALADAITAAQLAHHGTAEGVLTTYVVVAKRQWWDEQGGRYVAYYRNLRDDDVPLDEQLGLLEYAATRVRKLIAADEEAN